MPCRPSGGRVSARTGALRVVVELITDYEPSKLALLLDARSLSRGTYLASSLNASVQAVTFVIDRQLPPCCLLIAQQAGAPAWQAA